MATFKIKPQTGLTVRDPETREPLKAAGEEKPRNTYWLRRVKDKSVTIVGAKKNTSTKESEQ
ncbi:DUF2635 domain-containing protein [Vibrio scophthalmi]|uniref:Mu-like prophage FluMu protein gp38 n=1 Tax=Vibrio scophthalmi TaxID=45658 RepID=A0A1E3WH04_9VIBR|nr:DUF2635 domain-containing protein [Vibrio scophthalmi]MCY9805320.1 DUF2635 domain-containing protein [Vibrio scophthalmi]ODS04317.1 Mu-like prophage FluMu protein gp38 [Vibrio scophthalmi]